MVSLPEFARGVRRSVSTACLCLGVSVAGQACSETADSAAELSVAKAELDLFATERVSRELQFEQVSQLTAANIPILLHVRDDADAAAVSGWLTARSLSVEGSARAGDAVRIATLLPRDTAPDLASELGEQRGVFFVERVHRLGFFNDRSAGSVQSGRQGVAAAATPIWAHGLRGEGQIVGLIDSGLDADACQFRGSKLPKVNTYSANGYGVEVDDSHPKIRAYDFLFSCAQFPSKSGCEKPEDPMAWDNHGHGTHCAGSMVGSRMGGMNDGMAPAAKVVVQDGGMEMNTCSEMPGLGCPVVDLYPIFKQAYDQGVRIHNNSYGDNEEAPVPQQSNYSARSQDVDRFMWDHKDMLIVFAAGNSGSNNRNFSVGSPSTNKNGLSVGSVRTSEMSSSDENISSFSSRGWTSDGRIKPDILAPGCTTSAGSDKNVQTNNCVQDAGCGTSYAAPILVGAAALVRQYFTEGFYPSGAKSAADALTPSAALLKAMLLNGAVGVTGTDNAGQSVAPIPSNEQGWGRIQLDRSLVFTGGARTLFVDDQHPGFAAGDTTTVRYAFSGVTAAQPFKVTLAWTDFAGEVDSAPRAPKIEDPATYNTSRLVNDLDLTVDAGMNAFLGNAFEAGRSRAGGMADRRNNVEQVLLDSPMPGEITVSVTAKNIVKAGQDYALVVTGQWQSASRVVPGAMAPNAAGSGGMSAAAGTGATALAGSPSPDARGPSGAMPVATGAAAGWGAVVPGAGGGSTVVTAGAMAVTGAPPAIEPAKPVAEGCSAIRLGSRRMGSSGWVVLAAAIGWFTRRRRLQARAARQFAR